MKVTEFQGIACTATQMQLTQLLFLVDHVSTYRDWDWLDLWIKGLGPQNYTPEMVVKIYSNEIYWQAVKNGDIATADTVRDEVLGFV